MVGFVKPMVMQRKMKDWEGTALHFQILQQSFSWLEPHQNKLLGGKSPCVERCPKMKVQKGMWLQDCFCAGLKSYHCRIKLAKGAGTWDGGKEEGLGQRVIHA